MNKRKITIEQSHGLSYQEIYEFLQSLTELDKEEVLLVHNQNSLENIAKEYEKLLNRPPQMTYVLRLPCGRIIAIGGVYVGFYNYLWLLCTDIVTKYPISLYKECKTFFLTHPDETFAANIYIKNKAHIRFAESLGFKIKHLDNLVDFALYIKNNLTH